MSENYKLHIWRRAMEDAESAVMRATATQTGGRLKDESLMDYVERANRNQGIAIANWMTAKAEYEAALAAAESSPAGRT